MARSAECIPDSTLRLLAASGLGPRTIEALRAAFDDDDDAVACASVDELRHVRGIGMARARAIRTALDSADPDAQRAAMRAVGATVILRGDPEYPPLLSMIVDPPLALFIRGVLDGSDQCAVAVVGSRNCTTYGLEQANRLSGLLAQSGLTIVSGGARGVDGAAHRGARAACGRTVVVLGSGVDVPYPPRHSALFEEILASSSGALISECPMGAPPRPGNFPRRNRILSGMSLGVVVIEAALRSGALITARIAAEEHHREVLMLPGRVDSPASAGSLQAIREGWGTIIRNHADILESLESARYLLRGAIEHAAGTAPANLDDVWSSTLFELNLTAAQTELLERLCNSDVACDVEALASSATIPVSQLLSELTVLELRGLVTKVGRGLALSRRGRRLMGGHIIE